MRLTVQRRLAASIMGCSEKRVWFDTERLSEIKESITKADIRSLIIKGLVQERPKKNISRGRANEHQAQRRKGRRRGQGSREGTRKARLPKKEVWVNSIRKQRAFLKTLREGKHLSTTDYQALYRKAKGGFFRSKRHVKLYLEEHGMVKKK